MRFPTIALVPMVFPGCSESSVSQIPVSSSSVNGSTVSTSLDGTKHHKLGKSVAIADLFEKLLAETIVAFKGLEDGIPKNTMLECKPASIKLPDGRIFNRYNLEYTTDDSPTKLCVEHLNLDNFIRDPERYVIHEQELISFARKKVFSQMACDSTKLRDVTLPLIAHVKSQSPDFPSKCESMFIVSEVSDGSLLDKEKRADKESWGRICVGMVGILETLHALGFYIQDLDIKVFSFTKRAGYDTEALYLLPTKALVESLKAPVMKTSEIDNDLLMFLDDHSVVLDNKRAENMARFADQIARKLGKQEGPETITASLRELSNEMKKLDKTSLPDYSKWRSRLSQL